MTVSRVQGAIFTVMVLPIADPYDPALESGLQQQISRSPNFFANAPIVFDLKDCLGGTSPDDFIELKAMLKRQGMMAVGVQNASTVQQRAAAQADLAPFAAASGRRAPTERTASASPNASPTKLVTQPVRSGTQIYAKGGDLIVTAAVSPGAEVIADGHLHIYGPLRGRAIAGASGDKDARIFIHRLEAELLCVAGHYLVSEAIPPEHIGKPVQVALVEDEISIIPG